MNAPSDSTCKVDCAKVEAIRKWLGSRSINLMGPPGSGKDTVGQTLAVLLGAPDPISGGVMLRENPNLPPHVVAIRDSGGLIPSDDFLALIQDYLLSQVQAGRPVILSSVGRKDGEQFVVREACELAGHAIAVVLTLQLDDATCMQRLEARYYSTPEHERRADDDPSVLKTRLIAYFDETLPVLDYYEAQGIHLPIEADGSQDEVVRRVIDSLYGWSQARPLS